MGLISWYRGVWYRYFYGCEEESKTYVDVNGNEYDKGKYDFVKDWVVREKEVERKLENYKKDKLTFGDKLREKTEQNRSKVESAENKYIDDMYSKIKDMLMEEASQGRDSKSITGSEFEEIFGFRLLIGGSSPTSFWGRLKKKCNDNGFDIENDRPGIYTFSWGVCGAKNNSKAFGDELREISRESQKEKNDDFDKMMDKAREEAERLFDILKKEIVKYAKNGNFFYSINTDKLNKIIEENDIGVNNPEYIKMFFRGICERNNMNLMVLDHYDGDTDYVFSWGKLVG
ncbi:hypothetical protein A8C46_00135 [Ligilactobacillus salivarius]|uniref:hypothetical protein n=1 Tax=Ligilactobacillus salivarius TaxID=1624 RepID=UPI000A2E9775|nr:hypothetical protein [Ligilactobacillus salivarius]OTF89791.1 hypothetical protein A8C38_00505 [Ligilactobacillus salivarius]PAY43625.1 hypothetical protein A8C39_00685 [Ligilactobacillus salivarius]PAY49439.1 hypothetical protein A8C42_00830 [Ligilactobacillus salivarius]PAY51902.1 hypothetical protein A8C37_00765 [Ligilactobacillus salivarius]PAY54789.1 hypothetical protein A8C41_06625 [Ligilactobacillus salivarius]